MTLPQEIALTLRRRPLLLPMLLAACFVLFLFAVSADSHSDGSQLLLWGGVVPHIGLMSLWLASGYRHWLRKLVLTAALVVAVSMVFAASAIGWGEFPSALTFFSGYCLGASLCAVIANLALGYIRPSKEPIRFSTWQLLVVMTLIALAAPLARYAEWPIPFEDFPIFVGMIATPVVAWVSSLLMPRVWQYGVATLLFAGLFELAYHDNGPNVDGFFLLPAIVYVGWLWALSVQPDAKRRMSARRKRRSTAEPEGEASLSEPEVEPAPEPRLDLDA